MRHGIARTTACAGLLFAIAPYAGAAPGVAASASAAPTSATSPAGASPSSAAWRWTPELIADQVAIESAAISPDGKRVVFAATRARGEGDPPGPPHLNLWLVGDDGGAARRLTSADGEDDDPAWSPDGSAIAFRGARGGKDAKSRLFVLSLEGGEAAALTPEGVDVAAFAWSRDGARLAYVARDPKDMKQDAVVVGRDDRPRRLYVIDRAGGAARPVKALGDRSAWEIAWSPDGSRIAATVTPGAATEQSYLEKRILILPVEEGTEREVAPRVGKVHEVAWTKDGRHLLWNGGVDRSDPTFGSLFIAPVAGGAAVNLTGDRAETVRDIVAVREKSVVVAAMQGTGSALVEIDLQGGGRRDLLPAGRLAFTEASGTADGTRFAVVGSTPTWPAEIHRVDRRGARRLTDLNPAFASLPRGRQETVRWTASDGVAIEGILIRPADDAARASWPLVVLVHGGPEYEDLDGFDTTWRDPVQALAERGFIVLRPNYRGSTGRGVAFAKSDHGDLGGRDFQDVLDGIDALAPRYRIDRARVGMLGGSYGGYFANLAATRYGARFAAAVSLFGIADWISFLGQSDIPVENSEVHWALWCWERHDVCWRASPVAHVAGAKTPLLLLQGEADLRVPRAQSDEMFAALRWAKAPVEYFTFPREEHGFEERAHRIEATRRILEWFEEHLRP